jgi:hypothetical protein
VSTGLPREDAKIAFDRERRRRVLSKLAARLRFEPDDVSHILPFDEVVAALGYEGERSLGLKTIKLKSIVGTVDSARDFDRRFRPTSSRVRQRWEKLALAQRKGESMPPIDVYRVGDLHFVRDGHHRVSVARALKEKDINAHVIEVRTKLGAARGLQLGDLPLKAHERVFHERVPLARDQRERIQLSDEWKYAQLANLVEGWGYRASLDRGELLSRRELAHAWFCDEYDPVVTVLREEGLGGGGTETERYLRIAMLRFLLLQTFDWTAEIAERLSTEMRSPSAAAEKDTMTHQILKEVRD